MMGGMWDVLDDPRGIAYRKKKQTQSLFLGLSSSLLLVTVIIRGYFLSIKSYSQML